MDDQFTPAVTLTQIADPEEVFKDINDKVLIKTLGYAGFASREMMKKNSKIAQYPDLANSLTQRVSVNKKTVYIRSWVGGVKFGAYGHALAKQSEILPKHTQLMNQGKLGVAGIITKLNGNKTQGMLGADERTYGARTAKNWGIDNFDKIRVQTGTRINSKGKVVKTYKTTYTLKGSSNLNESGVLYYVLKNGEGRRSHGVKIATRPESLFWSNWIQNWGNEAFFSSQTQSAIVTYMNNRLKEMLEE